MNKVAWMAWGMTAATAMSCSSTGHIAAGSGGASSSSGGTGVSAGGGGVGGTSHSAATVPFATGSSTAISSSGGTVASGTATNSALGGTQNSGGAVAVGGAQISGGAFATGGTGVVVAVGGTLASGGAAVAGGTNATVAAGGTWAVASGGTASAAGGTLVAAGGTSGNDAATTGGSTYDAGTSNTGDILQPDGTLLIKGIIRDFHAAFPDMEPCSHDASKLCDIGSANIEENHTPSDTTRDCTLAATINAITYPTTCIVDTNLDTNTAKPSYAGPAGGTITTTGADNFNWWFKTDPSGLINEQSGLAIVLSPNGDGTFTFSSNAFFPIDNQLFGNEGSAHNNYFTTEFHLGFTYQPGQTLYLTGDDDFWVFINGELVIDRGGIHNARNAALDLQALGLVSNRDYSLDLFYCNRHATLSDLTITTSIEFNRSIVVN